MFVVEIVILRLTKTRKIFQLLIVSDKCKKCCKRVIETIKAIQCLFFSLKIVVVTEVEQKVIIVVSEVEQEVIIEK